MLSITAFLGNAYDGILQFLSRNYPFSAYVLLYSLLLSAVLLVLLSLSVARMRGLGSLARSLTWRPSSVEDYADYLQLGGSRRRGSEERYADYLRLVGSRRRSIRLVMLGWFQLTLTVALPALGAAALFSPLLKLSLVVENAPSREAGAQFADAEKNQIDTDLVGVRQVLSNVETLSLKELQTALVDTTNFVNRLSLYVAKQENYIREQKVRFDELQKAEEEARAKAEALAELREPQINALRELLTTDARQERRKGFINGILMSIPISILGSILGTMLLRMFTGR